MLKKFKHILKKFKSKPNTKVEINSEKSTVNIVKSEEIIATDNIEVMEYFSEQMGVPIFEGSIEHAYESDFLGYTNECPRCNSATQNKISNFSYATESTVKIMTGAAGHFCINCPSVIIDDDIVRISVQEEEKYYGVFIIETAYSEESGLFKTLNGEKIIYILDEDGEMGGIVQSVHFSKQSGQFDFLSYDPNPMKRLTTPTQQRKKSTNKRKNKAAKNARKKNRKR